MSDEVQCRIEIPVSSLYFLPVPSLSCLNDIVTPPPSGCLESLIHPHTYASVSSPYFSIPSRSQALRKEMCIWFLMTLIKLLTSGTWADFAQY